MSRLVVFLTDPLGAFYAKGELKARYYNPENLFSEVHFISPARQDIDADKVQRIVGNAKLVVHTAGPAYDPQLWYPNGHVARILSSIHPDVIRAYDPALRGSLAVYWGKRL